MPQREGYQNVVNLVVSLCLTYTLCIACVRVWIRKSAYGLDDVVVAVATLVTLSSTASSYAALAEGFGLPWPALQQSNKIPALDEAAIFGMITFIVAMYLSKCAMLVFLARITKTSFQVRLYSICNIVVAAIGMMSVLIVTVGCPTTSTYYWAFHANRDSCPSQTSRWMALTAFDIVTELLLLALPVHLVWGLQMPLRKKVMILVAFFLRLPVLGFSIGRNYYTLRLRLAETDAGLGSALVVTWMEVELAYALAASTLSALKTFTESFNSGFGLGFTRGKDDSHGSSDISGRSGQSSKTEKSKGVATTTTTMSDSTAMASRTRSPPPEEAAEYGLEARVSPLTPRAEEAFENTPLRLRPDSELKTFTRVCADPVPNNDAWHENSSVISGSTGGDEMVIMRHTGYEVQHDRAPMLPPSPVRASTRLR